MSTTTGILKARALELISTATSLEDVSYLLKSLADSGQIDSTISAAVNVKVAALSATSTAKEIAYIIKALETADAINNDFIYSIGVPGEIGFGVATCPADLLPTGWVGMSGHDDMASPNYGNYTDTNGSVLCYIPKHYFMFTANELSIKDQPTTGHVLDRSYINAGKEKYGVFVYKYGASNLNGIFGSQKFADPLSTNSTHNPISALTNAPANNNGGLYKAVKSAGANYYLTSIFNYAMLARIAYAHGKAATSTAACAYIDVAPTLPKGCLISALKDVNDAGVTYTPSGYSDCGMTGSGSPLAKTTHNGQDCGVADLNGNMWEVASGFTLIEAVAGTPASTDFKILKESVDITAILDDTTTAGTGAYDPLLYDALDLTGIIDGNSGWTYLGNGVETVFGMSTDRTTNTYRRTAVGIPTDLGHSTAGTTEFGNDGLYRYLRNEMTCIVGGSWSLSSAAGVFTVVLSNYRTNSDGSIGARACYLV